MDSFSVSRRTSKHNLSKHKADTSFALRAGACAFCISADVRVVTTTSEGYELHQTIKGGIAFDELRSGSTMSHSILGPWAKYGQSKLANILYASGLARRHPEIMLVSVHPGVVKTPMLDGLHGFNRIFNDVGCWLNGTTPVEPHQGALNQPWCAAGARGRELFNGSF